MMANVPRDDYAAAVHFLPNGTDAERIALAMAFHRAFFNGYASANRHTAADLKLMQERLSAAAKLHEKEIVPKAVA